MKVQIEVVSDNAAAAADSLLRLLRSERKVVTGVRPPGLDTGAPGPLTAKVRPGKEGRFLRLLAAWQHTSTATAVRITITDNQTAEIQGTNNPAIELARPPEPGTLAGRASPFQCGALGRRCVFRPSGIALLRCQVAGRTVAFSVPGGRPRGEVRSLPGKRSAGRTPERDGPIMVDARVARSARVYDYLLGGKDNFAADRDAGDEMIAALPNVVSGCRMNRAFLARAVRYLAAECGISQFLDIGTGMPSADCTHQVAQAIAPKARIVYVDNDPIVLVHARALLTGTPEGLVGYLRADLRDPEQILAAAARTLDFSQPVAVMMLMVLHMIPDADAPHAIVDRLVNALPQGSYLALSHPPSDILPQGVAEVQQRFNERLGPGQSMTARSRDEVARFFGGLELVPPGLVQVHQWRPDRAMDPDAQASIWCAVGRRK